MHIHWRTVTIFISSTFADMQSERDYLNTFVFPLIRSDLKKYAISLRIIDLRWGVNTLDDQKDESIERKIVRVCFDEIDRSKPFFLALLGERYGWIPSEKQMEELSHRYDLRKGSSITSMEIEYAVFRNENIQSLFFEREISSYTNISSNLRHIYDDRHSDLADNEKNIRIQKIENLKKEIKDTLSARGEEKCYYTYTADWTGNKFSGLEAFGEEVRRAMVSKVISFVSGEREEELDIIAEVEEKLLQDEFIFEHTKILVEREGLFATIKNKLISSNQGWILTGDSGQGKSSVYASLVNTLQTLPTSKYLVLYHSAGINPESSRIYNMLKRWIYEVAGYINEPMPEVLDTEQCLKTLKVYLKRVSSEIKIIMLVDSLNSFQVENASRYLTFFPRYEYRDISLFCTSTPGAESYAIQYNHSISPINCPPIMECEARKIIHSFFNYYRKEIHKDVVDALLCKDRGQEFAYTSPLWLSMAMQLLLSLGEDDFTEAKSIVLDNEEKKIKEFQKTMILKFPTEPKALFKHFLERMKYIYGSLPEQVFLLIACSYKGLQEDDIKAILSDNWDAVTFALVHLFFSQLLIEQGKEKCWKLAHQQLNQSFTKEEKEVCYLLICKYYWEKYENDLFEERDNLLYYLYHAKEFEKANSYISDNEEKDHIIQEAIQLLYSIGTKNFISFLDEVSTSSRYQKLPFILNKFKEMLDIGTIRELVRKTTAKLRYIGEYEKSMIISRFYAEKVIGSKIFGDLKMMLYLIIVNDMVNAIESFGSKKMQEETYEQIISNLKIRGPISLIIVPLSKKYYKWNLFKLKNNN